MKFNEKAYRALVGINHKYSKNKNKTYRVPIGSISIKPSFLAHRTKKSKLKERFDYYSKHNKFLVPIVIDKDWNLVDGYTSYQVAIKENIAVVPIQFEG